MKKYGRATVAEILGDNIIYRNLAPVDPGIPGITDLWKQVGLQSSRVPRKTTPEYASVVACMLNYISDQVNPNSPIKRVVFIGDTRLNDGMAFQNICMAGDWDGMAFIAAEKDEPTRFEVDEKKSRHNCAC